MDEGRVHRLVQGKSSIFSCFFLTYLSLAHVQLETDDNLLIPKARAALERYGHQVVIGNDLHRRKYEVVFVSPKAGDDDSQDKFEEHWLRIPVPDTSGNVSPHQVKEIEEDIVAELVRRHTAWIDAA